MMYIQILTFFCFSLLSGCETEVDKVEQPYTIQKRHILPKEIQETSGLITHRNLVWTFNDSGGKPQIYGINLSNDSIEQTITLQNAINQDWEEITQDKDFIYIGDFGNNTGTRKSLTIYKFPKTAIPPKGNASVVTEKINFSYPGYSPVAVPLGFSSFDCEAFVAINDSLYLFTKDWNNASSSVYSLPKTAGQFMAKKVMALNTKGLITGASYNEKGLVLIGYSNFLPFVIKYSFSEVKKINDKQSVRYDLSQIGTYQTEGICFNGNNLLISSEATRSPAQIIELTLK